MNTKSRSRARLSMPVTHYRAARPRPSSKRKAKTNTVPLSSSSLSSPSAPVKRRKSASRTVSPILDVPSSDAPSTPESSARKKVSSTFVVPDSLAAIREQYRVRQDVLRAQLVLGNQAHAIARRTLGKNKDDEVTPAELKEHTPPWIKTMIELPMAQRKHLERDIEKAVKALEIWKQFGEGVRGFGALSMGALIGERAIPSDFPTVAKLWKYMGMAVINGERQRKCADRDKAIEHAYCPRRRALMFVIGDTLIRAKGEYKAIYDARKPLEAAKLDKEGKPVRPIVAHKRAKRYMEKRLLREFWKAWRRVYGESSVRDAVSSFKALPDSLPLAAAGAEC